MHMQQSLRFVSPEGVLIATIAPSSRETGMYALSTLEDGSFIEQLVDYDIDELVQVLSEMLTGISYEKVTLAA